MGKLEEAEKEAQERAKAKEAAAKASNPAPKPEENMAAARAAQSPNTPEDQTAEIEKAGARVRQTETTSDVEAANKVKNELAEKSRLEYERLLNGGLDEEDEEEAADENPALRLANMHDEKRAAVTAAADKLRRLAMSYPETTPNEHTICGFAGVILKLGDLRDLFGLNRRR